MSREIPFDSDMTCDVCGETGAFDFYGDFLCANCSQKMFIERKRGGTNGETSD